MFNNNARCPVCLENRIIAIIDSIRHCSNCGEVD